MSFPQCPPPPKASVSNMDASWSPALRLQQQMAAIPIMALDLDQSYPYYSCSGRLVRHEECIAPELLAAIKQNHYMVRQIKASWWMMVEHEEAPHAQPHDSFLVRRDNVDYEILVRNPTEEELPTLKYKKRFMKNEMAYFRTIDIVVEYGSLYEGNNHWARYTVAYLKNGLSPYPFQKDCRPEHHKIGSSVPLFSS